MNYQSFSKTSSLTKLAEIYDISEDDVMLSYSGPFDGELIKDYAARIKILTEKHPKSGRKMFFTLVELLQNISFYSGEKSKLSVKRGSGAGSLLIGKTKDRFFFVSGNVIFLTAAKVLERKIQIINSLEREDLREYKREQRNLIPGSNGNAHIGLIMTSLTTKRPLAANFAKIDSKKYFFSLLVEVDIE